MKDMTWLSDFVPFPNRTNSPCRVDGTNKKRYWRQLIGEEHDSVWWNVLRLVYFRCSLLIPLSMVTTLDSAHNVIAGGMNPLYMSCFVAANPLIVLERKIKHSLLSILSSNMLNNVQLKPWLRGIWGLWSIVRQTSACLKKMPILDTYVFTERVWYVWKLELSLYMIKPPNRWVCRTQGYYVSHDTAPALVTLRYVNLDIRLMSLNWFA